MAIMSVPVLTEFQNTGLPHQASSGITVTTISHISVKTSSRTSGEKKVDSFISSYKFEDKKLGIYKKFLDA